MNGTSIPNDPFMLLSFLNMKLRDFYPSLDALCDDLELDATELTDKLASAGFTYDKEANRFQ